MEIKKDFSNFVFEVFFLDYSKNINCKINEKKDLFSIQFDEFHNFSGSAFSLDKWVAKKGFFF